MNNKTFLNILIGGFFILVLGFIFRVFGENFQTNKKINHNPKLVVGIVVDQMKYQYLTKYWNHYSEKGFKRLISEGFNAKSNHYGYAQTSTGPGHTTVATGTHPAVHGIIGKLDQDTLLLQLALTQQFMELLVIVGLIKNQKNQFIV